MNKIKNFFKKFYNKIKEILSDIGWKITVFFREIRGMDRTQKVILFFLSLVSVFMLLPLVYIFNHAFKPLHELFLFPPRFIVRAPTWQNFVELMSLTQSTFVPVSRYIFNSIVVTIITTIAMVITSAFCSYALSKHKFPGSNLVFS